MARDTQYYCPALLEHKCHLSTLTEGIKDDKKRASAGAGNQTCNHMNSVSAFQLKCNWEHTVNSGSALRPSPSDHTETFLRWSQNSLIEILWRLLKRLFSLPQRLYKKKAHYTGLICPFFSKSTFIPFQHRGKAGHQNSMFSAAWTRSSAFISALMLWNHICTCRVCVSVRECSMFRDVLIGTWVNQGQHTYEINVYSMCACVRLCHLRTVCGYKSQE